MLLGFLECIVIYLGTKVINKMVFLFLILAYILILNQPVYNIWITKTIFTDVDIRYQLNANILI